MAEPRVKSLAKPDEVMTFPLLTAPVVDLGDITVGHRRDGEWRLARFVVAPS